MARPFRYTEEQLSVERPELAKQWISGRNQSGLIDGKYLSQRDKYWWMCEEGHSWQATLAVRLAGSKCPICSGHEVCEGINDIQTLFPDIAAEWDHERNGVLKPNQVTAGSNKRVHWICSMKHRWEATVNRRTNGSKCPYCSSRKLLVGFNDLASTNPTLTAEWDQKKNGELTPQMVMAGADRSVWWICKQGHSWKAKVALRNIGSSCPICGNKILLPGDNDLVTQEPQLAGEWDYEGNEGVRPEQVLAGSVKSYWWKCILGHSYRATIHNRKKGNGCPYCSRQKVLAGFNDLSTTDPLIASQWDYEKNTQMSPHQVTAGVSRKFWWKCSKGHSWEATVNSRTNGNGCPYCYGRYSVEGETDLLTIAPIVSEYWDYNRNHGLRPEKVSSKATLIVWWKCRNGHHWRGMIRSMNIPNCPYCSGVRKRMTKYIT